MKRTFGVTFIAALLGPPFGTAQGVGQVKSPLGDLMLGGVNNAISANVVAGRPFSGTATMIVSWSLLNPGRRSQTSILKFYRDSQGRTRIEQPAGPPSPWSELTGKLEIKLVDPTGGFSYSLDPSNHVAFKTRLREVFPLAANEHPSSASDQHVVNLGTQTFLGLVCSATQVSRIIPPGMIGNAESITINTEKLYSQDLQLVLKYSIDDPSKGIINFYFYDISRTEPDPSLFSPSPDYVVKATGIAAK